MNSVGLGYYSVVCYVSDVIRRQPINVGVIVTYDGSAEWSFAQRDDLEDPGIVQRFGETIRYIFETEAPVAPGGERVVLDELAHRRFGQFAISEPRPVEVPSEVAPIVERLLTDHTAAAVSPSLTC